jgi:Rieske Fe-S protein
MGVCGAAAMLLPPSIRALSEHAGPLETFERVLLADSDGRPLSCGALAPEQEYVFFYPYACTPCFLLDLGRPTASPMELSTGKGRAYRWTGGVGPRRSVVAFSAICSHKLTHPSAAVSFIGYRRNAVGYPGGDKQIVRRAGVIQCCSEHSVYDPAQGARVLSGPAPQPLAAIALECQDDRLYAVGVYGGQVFERFFERFDFRLAMEFGGAHRERVVDRAVVRPLEDYSRQRIRC